ncbi:A-kinase anchor protein 17B-like [Macrotis lagotis]|uniref:A-kinase anchor protein 17B-like n=1 Tax=Macrotis lagotis TaxID=92651 RepID=UPI003D686572
MFVTTQYFNEGAVRKKKQERLKLQELEEERKKEKNQLEEERKRKEEEKQLQEKRKTNIKVQKQKQEEKNLKKKTKAEECGRVNSQEVENPKAEETCILKRGVKKEKPNPPNLLCQETKKKMSKKSIQCGRNLITQMEMDLPDSSCCFLGDLTEGEDFDKVIPEMCKQGFLPHLQSIQITIKPDKSQVIHSVNEDDKEEDGHIWNLSSYYKLYKKDYNRKKIYENDEFVDYLLNYYHPPKYDRFSDDPESDINKYLWKREVRVCENRAQIGFNQPDHHSTQNGQKLNWLPEDNQLRKSASQGLKPRSGESVNTICAEEHHYTDPSNEAVDLTSNVGRKQNPWHNSDIDPIKDSKCWDKTSSSQCLMEGPILDVEDYLEDISSDSDCFNDMLNETSEHQSPFPNASCLVEVRECSDDCSKTIAFEQEKKCDQCGTCPKLESSDLTKPLKSKFKKTVKRSMDELKCLGLKGECETNGMEEDTRRKKKKLLVEDRLEKNNYPAAELSCSLRKPEKKRSKVMESRMQCKASRAPIAPSRSIDAPSVHGFSENMGNNPWMLESYENARAFKRYIQWDDQTLNHSDSLSRSDSSDLSASENGL